MKKLLFLLLLPLAINCMDAPEITYEGPQLSYNQTEHEINAKNGLFTIGYIVYKYMGNHKAEILLFSVDADVQEKRIGQQLFQKCVNDIVAHKCNQIEWTVNPIGNHDFKTIRTIYKKIIQKLANPESYCLVEGEEFYEYNKKQVKMNLFIKHNLNCVKKES